MDASQSSAPSTTSRQRWPSSLTQAQRFFRAAGSSSSSASAGALQTISASSWTSGSAALEIRAHEVVSFLGLGRAVPPEINVRRRRPRHRRDVELFTAVDFHTRAHRYLRSEARARGPAR